MSEFDWTQVNSLVDKAAEVLAQATAEHGEAAVELALFAARIDAIASLPAPILGALVIVFFPVATVWGLFKWPVSKMEEAAGMLLTFWLVLGGIAAIISIVETPRPLIWGIAGAIYPELWLVYKLVLGA